MNGRRVVTRTPAGSHITVATAPERAGMQWVTCQVVNEKGVQTTNVTLSYNAAWAMAYALSQFFSAMPGQCELVTDEEL